MWRSGTCMACSAEMKAVPMSMPARGPFQPLALGTFHRGVSHCVACRVPARRPGNFGVRITSLREVSGPPLREHLQPQMKVTKAKGLNTHLVSTPWAPSRTGDLDASRCVNPTARSAGPCYAWAGHLQAHRHPMWPAQMSVEVVCFGDFHLDQQMKVTRPPGRDPARNALSNTSINIPNANGCNGPKAEARFMRRGSRRARWSH